MKAENNFFACVVDASFMASYLLGAFSDDERGFETAQKTIVALVKRNGKIFVPQIFFYEMGSVLQTALRRKRITKMERQEIEYDLFTLPLVFDGEFDAALMTRVQTLADEHTLSFYDAAYLELSTRLQIPLFTFDIALQKTAQKK